MPKSKNRKGHQEKVASYKKKVEDQKKLLAKRQQQFFEELQKAEMEKVSAESSVQNVVDSDDLGLDLGLDDLMVDTPTFDVVEQGVMVDPFEGVVSPEQLNK